MKKNRKYQYNFSEMLHKQMYDSRGREKKAKTMVAVLKNYFKTDLKSMSLLDIGCSTGFIANYLADYFEQVFGIDIDNSAIEFAQTNFKKKNLKYLVSDSMALEFPANRFDIVICAQVYEHVPDAKTLMKNIFRILKPGGVCYFAAGNRLNIKEAHYQLPFLSILPKPLGHVYVRVTRKAKFYYETHLTYWGLKKLVRDFTIIDCTKEIIQNPKQFHIDYMLPPNTPKSKIAQTIANYAYWLFPTYIWLLKKPVL